MKGYQTTETSEQVSRAAANNVAQKCNACSDLDQSPRQTAQAKMLNNLFASPIQRQAPEEEKLPGQAKFPAQMQEDEEKLPGQAKFPAQMEEEDDDAGQAKFPAQMQEDEEKLPGQAKFPIQEKPGEINENGLPKNVQAKMESALNTSFSNVNVHTDSSKASDVGALAYTQGNDIHVAPGQFKPDSSEGQKLIGHELGHIVQQREGRVQPTGEIGGLPLNDNPGLEHEADQVAEHAL